MNNTPTREQVSELRVIADKEIRKRILRIITRDEASLLIIDADGSTSTTLGTNLTVL